MSDDLPSFNANYDTLKSIAERIKNEGNKDIPDIDNLLPMVEAATAAYKACKVRLDAVEPGEVVLGEGAASAEAGAAWGQLWITGDTGKPPRDPLEPLRG